MPRHESYPSDNGRLETIEITSVDGRFFEFRVPRRSYSVTMYSDGTCGVCLPEFLRGQADALGLPSLCIVCRPEGFVAIRD